MQFPWLLLLYIQYLEAITLLPSSSPANNSLGTQSIYPLSSSRRSTIPEDEPLDLETLIQNDDENQPRTLPREITNYIYQAHPRKKIHKNTVQIIYNLLYPQWNKWDSSSKTECPPTYERVGQTCLSLTCPMESSGWKEARLYCRVIKGGDLAVFSSDAEMIAAIRFIRKTDKHRQCSYWIGGSDLDSDDEWKWHDGRIMPYGSPPWGQIDGKVEPGGGEYENFAMLYNKDNYLIHDIASEEARNTLIVPLCQVVAFDYNGKSGKNNNLLSQGNSQTSIPYKDFIDFLLNEPKAKHENITLNVNRGLDSSYVKNVNPSVILDRHLNPTLINDASVSSRMKLPSFGSRVRAQNVYPFHSSPLYGSKKKRGHSYFNNYKPTSTGNYNQGYSPYNIDQSTNYPSNKEQSYSYGKPIYSNNFDNYNGPKPCRNCQSYAGQFGYNNGNNQNNNYNPSYSNGGNNYKPISHNFGNYNGNGHKPCSNCQSYAGQYGYNNGNYHNNNYNPSYSNGENYDKEFNKFYEIKPDYSPSSSNYGGQFQKYSIDPNSNYQGNGQENKNKRILRQDSNPSSSLAAVLTGFHQYTSDSGSNQDANNNENADSNSNMNNQNHNDGESNQNNDAQNNKDQHNYQINNKGHNDGGNGQNNNYNADNQHYSNNGHNQNQNNDYHKGKGAENHPTSNTYYNADGNHGNNYKVPSYGSNKGDHHHSNYGNNHNQNNDYHKGKGAKYHPTSNNYYNADGYHGNNYKEPFYGSNKGDHHHSNNGNNQDNYLKDKGSESYPSHFNYYNTGGNHFNIYKEPSYESNKGDQDNSNNGNNHNQNNGYHKGKGVKGGNHGNDGKEPSYGSNTEDHHHTNYGNNHDKNNNNDKGKGSKGYLSSNGYYNTGGNHDNDYKEPSYGSNTGDHHHSNYGNNHDNNNDKGKGSKGHSSSNEHYNKGENHDNDYKEPSYGSNTGDHHHSNYGNNHNNNNNKGKGSKGHSSSHEHYNKGENHDNDYKEPSYGSNTGDHHHHKIHHKDSADDIIDIISGLHGHGSGIKPKPHSKGHHGETSHKPNSCCSQGNNNGNTPNHNYKPTSTEYIDKYHEQHHNVPKGFDNHENHHNDHKGNYNHENHHNDHGNHKPFNYKPDSLEIYDNGGGHHSSNHHGNNQHGNYKGNDHKNNYHRPTSSELIEIISVHPHNTHKPYSINDNYGNKEKYENNYDCLPYKYIQSHNNHNDDDDGYNHLYHQIFHNRYGYPYWGRHLESHVDILKEVPICGDRTIGSHKGLRPSEGNQNYNKGNIGDHYVAVHKGGHKETYVPMSKGTNKGDSGEYGLNKKGGNNNNDFHLHHLQHPHSTHKQKQIAIFNNFVKGKNKGLWSSEFQIHEGFSRTPYQSVYGNGAQTKGHYNQNYKSSNQGTFREFVRHENNQKSNKPNSKSNANPYVLHSSNVAKILSKFTEFIENEDRKKDITATIFEQDRFLSRKNSLEVDSLNQSVQIHSNLPKNYSIETPDSKNHVTKENKTTTLSPVAEAFADEIQVHNEKPTTTKRNNLLDKLTNNDNISSVAKPSRQSSPSLVATASHEPEILKVEIKDSVIPFDKSYDYESGSYVTHVSKQD